MAEPRNRHDPTTCAVWLSPNPKDGCTCRHDAEQTWHRLTPAQRAQRYDLIASTPQTGHRR